MYDHGVLHTGQDEREVCGEKVRQLILGATILSSRQMMEICQNENDLLLVSWIHRSGIGGCLPADDDGLSERVCDRLPVSAVVSTVSQRW